MLGLVVGLGVGVKVGVQVGVGVDRTVQFSSTKPAPHVQPASPHVPKPLHARAGSP